MASALDRPLSPWLRVILLLVAAQALLLISVFFQPGLVSLLVPWPAPPLHAGFIASLYTSLGVGVLLCAFARSFREARIVLLGIGLATLLLLLITIPHLGELRPFPLFWTIFYIVDPILVAIAFWRLRAAALAQWSASGLSGLWLATGAIYGVLGVFLLIAPGAAASIWPWKMSVELAQLYSAFFVALAVVALVSSREAQWRGVRWLVWMLGLLALCTLAVSLAHLPTFRPGVAEVVWFVAWAAQLVIFGGLFTRRTWLASSAKALAYGDDI
jgi:hypothetical protein